MKKFSIVLIVFAVVLLLAGCGSDAPEPSVEYDTAGGYHAEVFKDCPVDYAAAISGAISKIVHDSDTSDLAPQDCTITYYDNGMARIVFSNVSIGGIACGGEAYMEFKDDTRKDYSVHYLQIANKEYVNDGIDLSQYDEQ